MRALPVIAVALLVCSAVVGATGGLGGSTTVSDDRPSQSSPALDPATPVAQTDNGSLQQINVLDMSPTSIERWGVEQQYVDLGPAVGLSTNATTDHLRTLVMVERIETANTTAERRERLETALQDLEAGVEDLDRRQTAAIAAYGRGDISSRELLVTLVRVSIAAEELNDRRSRIESLAAETRGFDVDRGRVAATSNRLSAFRGPVRAHAEAVLRGESAPHRFYFAVGPESVTVSTIRDDTYLRESYRGDLRNGAGDAIELEVALDIVSSSYPVIWNTTREQTQVFGGGETYPVRVVHSRGDLTAFVDSDARVVYAEHQQRPLGSMVANRRAEGVGEETRLVVNQTYPGGPAQIRVVDAATGDPVDATVSMAIGTSETNRLGTTGDDGVLWTLSPYRRYTVTTDARGESVEVAVDPGSPPRIETVDTTDADNATPTPTPTSTLEGDSLATDLYDR
jgi:hypothetical protein